MYIYIYRLFVLHFWTSWSEPCIQINEALDDLAKEFTNCIFLKVCVYIYIYIYIYIIYIYIRTNEIICSLIHH